MQQRIFVNRRARPRIDVVLRANFESDGKELQESVCRSINLSVSGAGLVFAGLSDRALAPGNVITLEFAVPGAGQPTYGTGKIVWIKCPADAVAAGVNFFEPLPFENIVRCLGVDANGAKRS